MMRLTRTAAGAVLERDGETLLLDRTWDELFRTPSVHAYLPSATGTPVDRPDAPLAPVSSQEVWAAGITYYVSRDARMEESVTSDAADVYDRCYDAERPELFFKATPSRVSDPGADVRIRQDSNWNVPEPELTIAITSTGEVLGYTIGNDMSSRDIEGENPLYLPQAKIYDGCASAGPSILVTDARPDPAWSIALVISRSAGVGGVREPVFSDRTTVAQIRRPFEELIEYLHRDNTFGAGCLLMTGTGIVPPSSFTLEPGDEVSITIDEIGTLTNSVARSGSAPTT